MHPYAPLCTPTHPYIPCAGVWCARDRLPARCGPLQGSSLGELLESLYERYGFHDYRTGYFITDGGRSRAVFDSLRSGGQYARAVAGVPVVAVRDLGGCRRRGGRGGLCACGRARAPRWASAPVMADTACAGMDMAAGGVHPQACRRVGQGAEANGLMPRRCIPCMHATCYMLHATCSLPYVA